MLSAIGAVAVLAAAIPGGTIWNDGFESGNLDPNFWSLEGDGIQVVTSLLGHDSNSYVNFQGQTGIGGIQSHSSLLLELPSFDDNNLTFGFWAKVHSGLEVDDSIVVEWSDDGATWNHLISITNQPIGSWTEYAFDLPPEASAGEPLNFRFTAELGSATDRLLVDDVSIAPEPASLLLLGLGSLVALRRGGRPANQATDCLDKTIYASVNQD